MMDFDETDIDPLFTTAVELLKSHDRITPEMLRNHLKVGVARAYRIINQLEILGMIGPYKIGKPREVSKEYFLIRPLRNKKVKIN